MRDPIVAGSDVDASFAALLGTAADLRSRMKRTLVVAGFVAFLVAVEWVLVALGRVDGRVASAFTAIALVGVVATAAAIRRGWSTRFADPALSMPQAIFVLVLVAVAYWSNRGIDGGVRGALLALAALVVVANALVLSPRRCRQVGWLALDALGIAMALVAWRSATPARDIEPLHFAIALVVLPSLGLLAARLARYRIERDRDREALRDAVKRLEALALRDETTGIPNRRHVQEWVVHERARNRRSGTSLCVAILDLDHFKRINDTLGHPTGDEVLRIVARTANLALRDCDVLARWGGEEFLLVMPDTSIVAGRLAIERFRERLARPASWEALPEVRVTFSAGLTTMESDETLEDAVGRADAALYDAKRAGRDRIVVAFPPQRAAGPPR